LANKDFTSKLVELYSGAVHDVNSQLANLFANIQLLERNKQDDEYFRRAELTTERLQFLLDEFFRATAPVATSDSETHKLLAPRDFLRDLVGEVGAAAEFASESGSLKVSELKSSETNARLLLQPRRVARAIDGIILFMLRQSASKSVGVSAEKSVDGDVLTITISTQIGSQVSLQAGSQINDDKGVSRVFRSGTKVDDHIKLWEFAVVSVLRDNKVKSKTQQHATSLEVSLGFPLVS
jgi:hypothetical protein